MEEILRANLSDEQFDAATDTHAEVLTLACAGSGKSRTLAFRIAWLIGARGASPEDIVAFTFTEKAADAIKLRVAHALAAVGIDPNVLGRMYIGTIHSYCQYVLGQMDARYRQFDVLDDNRLKLYLIENYPRLRLHVLRQQRGARYFQTIKSFHDAWVQFNEELMNVADVAGHDATLAESLQALSGALIEDEFLDFSLMQRLVVEDLWRDDSAARVVVERLAHLLVDEYQDINPIQEALIQSLHEHGRSLFVVGDDDQSIYGWRGADVTRIQSFLNRFPEGTRHTLSTNYRGTPLIVQSADRFAHEELGAQRIAKNPNALNVAPPHEFRRLWFQTRHEEAAWIANKIRELLGTAYVEDDGETRGLTPADFAILMQSTRTPETQSTEPRHEAFTMALGGIPFSLESGGGLFERAQVAVLRTAFEMFRDGQPSRDAVDEFHRDHVVAVYPHASLPKLYALFTTWGRDIHAPVEHGAPRRRIYPQNLVFDLLGAFGLRDSDLDDSVVQDIGVFSQIIQDVEAVYPSVDSTGRFTSILNFLNVIAKTGYDTSSSELVSRPDAVTVSTVHKMKGLEFPVVFVVDVENQRFPKRLRRYAGWLPEELLHDALVRGAYQSTREEQARLFYTALTRAERFLYVTGSANGPGGGQPRRNSPFVAHLNADAICTDPAAPTAGLAAAEPRRRIEASSLPTSYSDIRYYLRCPKDYQFRKVFGFSPAIPDMFGFGNTVHASIGKLHEKFPNRAPTPDEAAAIARDIFHLKHVLPSNDPENRPGPYERASNRAAELASSYAANFGTDFQQRRQVEARFEIPADDAIVSGAIDLMIQEDEAGNVVDACVVDFKTIAGGEDPANSLDLDWTELALQVQLYAKAAVDILGNPIEDGFVHLLKDDQRVRVPISAEAIEAAMANVEWAVQGIISGDFPMRPSEEKCENCDFKKICRSEPQPFGSGTQPPAIHVAGENDPKMVTAFSDFDG